MRQIIMISLDFERPPGGRGKAPNLGGITSPEAREQEAL